MEKFLIGFCYGVLVTLIYKDITKHYEQKRNQELAVDLMERMMNPKQSAVIYPFPKKK